MEVPKLPEPKTPPEPEDWFFDSARGYEEQLAVYNARAGKITENDEEEE